MFGYVNRGNGISTRLPILTLIFIIFVISAASYPSMKPLIGSNDATNLQFQRSQVLLSDVEELILERVNDVRLTAGFNPLIHEEQLSDIARKHSMDMIERGFFSHHNPEGLGPAERVANQHRSLIGTITENLWTGIRGDLPEAKTLSEQIMKGLMASVGHRKNILTPNLTHLGIGVSQAAGLEVLTIEIMATQLFAAIKASTRHPIPMEFKWGTTTHFSVVRNENSNSRNAEFVDLWSLEKKAPVSDPSRLGFIRMQVPRGTYQLRFFFQEGGNRRFAIYPGPTVTIH